MNRDASANMQAIIAYREKLKAMTPEQRAFEKMRLNSDYTYNPFVRCRPPAK